MIQSKQDLESWYSSQDPWDYEHSLEDAKRRDILLHELPDQPFKKVLDIGCGHGFITKDLPGSHIIGTDLSTKAIQQAKKIGKPKKTTNKNVEYLEADLFELPSNVTKHSFDLIVITGVLYPQYIGKANTLSYLIIDNLLKRGGVLASVHINEWYTARFPYLRLKELQYNYREYTHRLEIYIK